MSTEKEWKSIYNTLMTNHSGYQNICSRPLTASWIETPLGCMLAIADDTALCLLEFLDKPGLEPEIGKLQSTLNAAISLGSNWVLESVKQALRRYFSGELEQFDTPLRVFGSHFQQQVWGVLRQIPYGKTRSYGEQAAAIGKPTACRAVARANAANRIAIIVPCHRIINANGELGGYAGGVQRKRWLIEHEKSCQRNNPSHPQMKCVNPRSMA